MCFANLTDISYAFRNCSSLKSIDLTYFDISQVSTMSGLFFGCSSIESIHLNKYMINASDMKDLFNGCSSLKNVSLSVAKTLTAERVFKGCDSLKYIDLSQFYGNNIEFTNDFFLTNALNTVIIYNSSIFEKFINKIPESWIQIDIGQK